MPDDTRDGIRLELAKFEQRTCDVEKTTGQREGARFFLAKSAACS